MENNNIYTTLTTLTITMTIFWFLGILGVNTHSMHL
jgi:hypothetical protein